MNSIDPMPPIESDLIDLGTVPFAHLRWRNDSVLRQSIRSALERTSNLRSIRRSGQNNDGERVD
jgi:hypothetical protein